MKAELADVYEVFRSYIAHSEISLEEITRLADEKKVKVGGFDDGKLLLQTSLPKPNSVKMLKLSEADALPTHATVEGSTLRIPFNFFGFHEIGKIAFFELGDLDKYVQLTLQNDCIELTISDKPKQLRLFND